MVTALDGIRVLECGAAHLGPRAGEMLAELGAEVIKIENKTEGDMSRAIRRINGRSTISEATGRNLYFEGYNLNKESIAIDLKKTEGREIVYRLVDKSDVFFSNYRIPAMRRLGLDYDTLHRLNPKLIYAIGSGYGPNGPDHELPAFDLVGQARSGIMRNQKRPDDVPNTVVGIADEMGAIAIAFGILAALFAREHCGEGQEVNVSLLGSMMWLQSSSVIRRLLIGHEPPPIDRHQTYNPLMNVYRCKDGEWLCLHIGGTIERYWPNLCRALNKEELAQDSRFRSSESRESNSKELIAILDNVFSKLSRTEWLDVLRKEEGLVYAPVNSISDLISDRQIIENDYIVDYDHPILGKIKVMRLPIQFSHTPLKEVSPAPEHGEHTDKVLFNIGGYSSEEIADFRSQGVI